MCNNCVHAETTGTQMSLIQDKNPEYFLLPAGSLGTGHAEAEH